MSNEVTRYLRNSLTRGIIGNVEWRRVVQLLLTGSTKDTNCKERENSERLRHLSIDTCQVSLNTANSRLLKFAIEISAIEVRIDIALAS